MKKRLDMFDRSFRDCKHKHMMKSGAPPDKFGVLYSMITYRINFTGYHFLVPGLISIFFEMVWVPLSMSDLIKIKVMVVYLNFVSESTTISLKDRNKNIRIQQIYQQTLSLTKNTFLE